MEKQQLLSFFQNYVAASQQNLEKIVAEFEEVRFSKNEFFLKEGKISNDYLFLAEGFMRSFTFNTEGNEVTTYFHSENKVVFDVSSFFMRIPSTENIQALTVSSGYIISYDKLNELFHSMPEFREFGRAMLVKEFSAFKQRTLMLINKSADERYAILMQTNKEVFQYAQLKYIASYLGITDTSLSRIRKGFLKK
ncbi:MAG: Crp/Fnr family transcriptional regulator [Bacteroidota bacterium]